MGDVVAVRSAQDDVQTTQHDLRDRLRSEPKDGRRIGLDRLKLGPK